MNWLLPSKSILHGITGTVRTVGEPQKKEREAARFQRYEASGKRKKKSRAAYFREWYAKNLEHRRAYNREQMRRRRAAGLAK